MTFGIHKAGCINHKNVHCYENRNAKNRKQQTCQLNISSNKKIQQKRIKIYKWEIITKDI